MSVIHYKARVQILCAIGLFAAALSVFLFTRSSNKVAKREITSTMSLASEWTKFVGKVASLSPEKQRAVGFIVGALVADAAAQPLHWIYDVNKLQGLVKNLEEPAFMSPPHCPYYNLPTGSHTPCGQEAFLQLTALAQAKGLDLKVVQDAFMKFYGPGSEVFENSKKREASGGSGPITWAYSNHPIKDFVKAVVAGSANTAGDSDDPDALARCLPVAAYYAGQPGMLAKVRECALQMQKLDLAVGAALAAARTAEALILDRSQPSRPIQDLLEGVAGKLEKPQQGSPHQTGADADLAKNIRDAMAIPKDQASVEALQKIGLGCSLPGSFKGAMFLLLQKGEEDYAHAVRNAMCSGGDTSARVMFVGGCMGARRGISGIPPAWASQTLSIKGVMDSVETLFF